MGFKLNIYLIYYRIPASIEFSKPIKSINGLKVVKRQRQNMEYVNHSVLDQLTNMKESNQKEYQSTSLKLHLLIVY